MFYSKPHYGRGYDIVVDKDTGCIVEILDLNEACCTGHTPIDAACGGCAWCMSQQSRHWGYHVVHEINVPEGWDLGTWVGVPHDQPQPKPRGIPVRALDDGRFAALIRSRRQGFVTSST